jgi:nitrite reductase/ring-hydroxylating ferredoxin subunit
MEITGVPALHLAGTYRRSVNASLARIWENVFDWEHLAHLHDGSFAKCELIDSGPWGWRIRLTVVGGDTSQVIEMRADRAAHGYTSTTLEGAGLGSEIRVLLAPVDTNRVDVTVGFHLPELDPARLDALGAAYVAAYARLWDEDESMMQARARALSQRRAPDHTEGLRDLGDERTVRAALPMALEFGGAPFRLIDLAGEIVAHSAVCPHWLGPLDHVPVVDGEIRCPWHGYLFDVASGLCAAHPSLKLARAPEILLVDGRVVACWG